MPRLNQRPWRAGLVGGLLAVAAVTVVVLVATGASGATRRHHASCPGPGATVIKRGRLAVIYILPRKNPAREPLLLRACLAPDGPTHILNHAPRETALAPPAITTNGPLVAFGISTPPGAVSGAAVVVYDLRRARRLSGHIPLVDDSGVGPGPIVLKSNGSYADVVCSYRERSSHSPFAFQPCGLAPDGQGFPIEIFDRPPGAPHPRFEQLDGTPTDAHTDYPGSLQLHGSTVTWTYHGKPYSYPLY